MQKKTRRPTIPGLPALGGSPKTSDGPATTTVGHASTKSKGTDNETPFLAAAVKEDSGFKTSGGTWSVNHHNKISTESPLQRGTDIKLSFSPNAMCDASKIELTQTSAVTRHRKGAPKAGAAFGSSAARKGRAVHGPGEYRPATHIDRSDGYSSPFFGVDDPDIIQRQNETAVKEKTHQSYKEEQNRSGAGSRVAGATSGTDAWLHDRVRQNWKEGDTLDSRYETAAIATEGPQKGIVYGSVTWGFKVDAAGEVTLKPLKVESVGNASATFHKAMDAWNEQDTYSMEATINTADKDAPEKLVKSRPFKHENTDWTLPESKVSVQDSMPTTKADRATRAAELDAAMGAIEKAQPKKFSEDLTYKQLAFEKKALGSK